MKKKQKLVRLVTFALFTALIVVLTAFISRSMRQSLFIVIADGILRQAFLCMQMLCITAACIIHKCNARHTQVPRNADRYKER